MLPQAGSAPLIDVNAQLVPGTRMPFEGIANDAERAAVIQYLKTLL